MQKLSRFVIKFVAFFSIIFLIYIFIQSHPSHFDGNRIALIDVIGNNYVFRGNNPLNEKDGDHFLTRTEMTMHFNRILNRKGLTPLENNYRMISVSFLDLNEIFEAQREESFFIENDINEFFLNYYLIQPTLLLGKAGIPFISPHMSDRYHAWFTSKLWEIHGLASLQRNKPTVIYIHCNAGRDRTGLFVSNYKLLFGKNTDMQSIVADNISESGRHVHDFYDRTIKDYCNYLKRRFSFELDCS